MGARTDPTEMGTNRTGIKASPLDGKATREGAVEGSPPPSFDMAESVALHVDCARGFGPVGTMPPPGSLKGAVKTAVGMLKGTSPNVFLDKLGERLAFERTGVRLYEAATVKAEAADPHAGGPSVGELEHIRDEELAHFHLLAAALETMGADPTSVTPGADVTAVLSSGLSKVATDPRVTPSQTLEALLTAELVDNDGWQTLAELADSLGHDELAADFRRALAEEDEHLERVRTWVSAAVNVQAGVVDARDDLDAAPPTGP